MGKMLVIDKSNKGLISKLFINEVIQLSIKKRTQFNNEKNRYSSKESMQMASKDMKRCSALLIIREVHIKTMR